MEKDFYKWLRDNRELRKYLSSHRTVYNSKMAGTEKYRQAEFNISFQEAMYRSHKRMYDQLDEYLFDGINEDGTLK